MRACRNLNCYVNLKKSMFFLDFRVIFVIFEIFVKCSKMFEMLRFLSFFIILLFYVFKLLFKHFLTPGKNWEKIKKK